MREAPISFFVFKPALYVVKAELQGFRPAEVREHPCQRRYDGARGYPARGRRPSGRGDGHWRGAAARYDERAQTDRHYAPGARGAAEPRRHLVGDARDAERHHEQGGRRRFADVPAIAGDDARDDDRERVLHRRPRCVGPGRKRGNGGAVSRSVCVPGEHVPVRRGGTGR